MGKVLENTGFLDLFANLLYITYKRCIIDIIQSEVFQEKALL